MATFPYSAALKRSPKLMVRHRKPEHPPALMDKLYLVESHIELHSVTHTQWRHLLSCAVVTLLHLYSIFDLKEKLTENYEVIELPRKFIDKTKFIRFSVIFIESFPIFQTKKMVIFIRPTSSLVLENVLIEVGWLLSWIVGKSLNKFIFLAVTNNYPPYFF